MLTSKTLFSAFTVVYSVCFLQACNKPDQTSVAPAASTATQLAPEDAAKPVQPAVSVTTVLAQLRQLPTVLKATGTVVPLNSVDVRSQVSSVISRVHFKEGQFVNAGALLFTLDSRLDEATVAKAQAQLDKDQAVAADAARQLARNKQLLAQNFISPSVVDTSQANLDTQTAVLAADRAAINAARVPLGYAKVLAPASGRVGAVNVFVGSTVQLGVTPLVTITQLDPIAVSFNLPQSNLADVLTALKNKATVMVKLPDGSPAYKGRVQFVDSVIDASAGTIKVKALVANPDGKLWPGAFVDTQLTLDSSSDHIVIPQAAIIQTARGSIVYAVVDGKAVSKPVELINAQGGNAAVKGVEAGDKVVLDGRQNLRPGVDVVERGGKPDGAKTDSAKAESKSTSKP